MVIASLLCTILIYKRFHKNTLLSEIRGKLYYVILPRP